MKTIKLLSPAKVNFYLKIAGKRPDGYHELLMLNAPVSLFDEIEIEAVEGGGEIRVTSEGNEHVPSGDGNICHKAARFYFDRTGVAGGADIRVKKRIPSGAGLGGGSGDAATVMLGLEKLYGKKLTDEDKTLSAFKVGADVPFFFCGGPAFVAGIGEKITQVEIRGPVWMVIVHPGVFLSTAAVFKRANIGLTSAKSQSTISHFDFQGIAKIIENDLFEPALSIEPAVLDALNALKGAGAVVSSMSGSGSAVFGLFRDEESARVAEAKIKGAAHPAWTVCAVHTLDKLPQAVMPG